MNLVQVKFSERQYLKEEYPKKQIYLHHTAGGPDGVQVFRFWESSPDRIATCVVIEPSGRILQGFSSKYWAYHLGVKGAAIPLDKISIGIELCNWGQLTLKDSKFYSYTNREIPESQVQELDVPFKGHKYFHNYTDAQIEATKDLLLLWNNKYGIPLDYNEDIWGLTQRALSGGVGVFTHNSVRADKVDVYPHPKLVQMLKTL